MVASSTARNADVDRCDLQRSRPPSIAAKVLEASALTSASGRRTLADRTCESCRVELDDHSRLAETLRRHASRVSPLASVEANNSAEEPEVGTRGGRARRWAVPMATAIVVLLLGGLFVQGEIRSDDLESRLNRIEVLERAQLAAADPTAAETTLLTPRNVPVLTVVSRAVGGPSYAMNSVPSRLAGGRTYQLWRVDKGAVTPAVALGRRPTAVVFSLPRGVTGFLLTVENAPAPGRPTPPAVAAGTIGPG